MLTKFTLFIYRINDINFVNMQDIYVFCLFGFFRPTRELFTRVKTPTVPEKGCTF